jgi:SAM-dependent methyltransferase
MSSYLGRHAELYDLFYAEKPYDCEAGFVVDQLKCFGVVPPARILEVACGTGRHAIGMESHGYQVVATDYSEDMLRAARQRASNTQSKVDFRFADMRDIDLPFGPFDAAICLFDSIGYVQTNESILKALKSIGDNVRPGGCFVFEFWHAAAMLQSFDPLRIRRWKTDSGEVLRISETRLEQARQLSHVTYTIYELNEDGSYHALTETQTNRYFLLQEMSALLSMCGWQLKKCFAGFTSNELIDSSTWHIVAVSQRISQAFEIDPTIDVAAGF